MGLGCGSRGLRSGAGFERFEQQTPILTLLFLFYEFAVKCGGLMKTLEESDFVRKEKARNTE